MAYLRPGYRGPRRWKQRFSMRKRREAALECPGRCHTLDPLFALPLAVRASCGLSREYLATYMIIRVERAVDEALGGKSERYKPPRSRSICLRLAPRAPDLSRIFFVFGFAPSGQRPFSNASLCSLAALTASFMATHSVACFAALVLLASVSLACASDVSQWTHKSSDSSTPLWRRSNAVEPAQPSSTSQYDYHTEDPFYSHRRSEVDLQDELAPSKLAASLVLYVLPPLFWPS